MIDARTAAFWILTITAFAFVAGIALVHVATTPIGRL
jgi:hypothetical protein